MYERGLSIYSCCCCVNYFWSYKLIKHASIFDPCNLKFTVFFQTWNFFISSGPIFTISCWLFLKNMKLLITNVVFIFPCQNNDLDTLEHTKLHGKYRNSFQLTSTRYFHNINLRIIYFFNKKDIYRVSVDHVWVICEGEDYFCCQYRCLFVTVLPNNGVVRKTCVSHNSEFIASE